MKTKICRTCKKELILLKDFYVYKGIARNECRKCTIQRTKAYFQSLPPEKIRKRKEFLKEYSANYYLNNKEKFEENRKRFKENNPGYPRIKKHK